MRAFDRCGPSDFPISVIVTDLHRELAVLRIEHGIPEISDREPELVVGIQADLAILSDVPLGPNQGARVVGQPGSSIDFGDADFNVAIELLRQLGNRVRCLSRDRVEVGIELPLIFVNVSRG